MRTNGPGIGPTDRQGMAAPLGRCTQATKQSSRSAGNSGSLLGRPPAGLRTTYDTHLGRKARERQQPPSRPLSNRGLPHVGPDRGPGSGGRTGKHSGSGQAGSQEIDLTVTKSSPPLLRPPVLSPSPIAIRCRVQHFCAPRRPGRHRPAGAEAAWRLRSWATSAGRRHGDPPAPGHLALLSHSFETIRLHPGPTWPLTTWFPCSLSHCFETIRLKYHGEEQP